MVTNGTASITSKVVSTAKPSRNYFLIQNKSNTDILVSFGATTDGGGGFLLNAGNFYEPLAVPTNEIYVSLANQNAEEGSEADFVIIEGTN